MLCSERDNFQNEIIWCYRKWTRRATRFPRAHDVILLYFRSDRPTFNVQHIPVSKGTLKRWKGQAQDSVFVDGVRLQIATEKKSKTPCPDWWEISIINPNASERVGYPTQKPLALLWRIIAASSNPGDVVLDPFCGCATTLVAAEQLGRHWIGIDISPKAAELVVSRLVSQGEGNIDGEIGPITARVTHRTDIPKRTDLGKLPPYNSPPNKRKLYGEQEGNCAGCNMHFEARHLTVDHIIARAKGGTDHIENLQLLCGSCNSIKGDRGMEYLRVKLQL